MKRNSTFLRFPLGRILVLLMAIGLWPSTASAADLGELELGKEYEITQNSTNKATFTAPATGTLTISGYTGCPEVSTNEDMSESYESTFVAYSPYTSTIEVISGVKYYLDFGYSFDSQKFTLSMPGMGEKALQLVGVDPAQGGYYDLSTEMGADVDLIFNLAMTVNQGKGYKIFKVVEGTNVKEWDYSSEYVIASGTFVSVKNVQEKIVALLKAADGLKVNDEIWVAIPGLQSASGQTLEGLKTIDGVDYLCIDYKVPSEPVKLVTANQLSQQGYTFLSYWVEGAPEAQLELEFDGNVAKGPNTSFQITYGSPDPQVGEDAFYQEELPITIDGKKVKVDLSGKLRTHQLMLPLYDGTAFTTIGLRLVGLVDENGNYVASDGAGKVGTYEWNLPYKQLEYANIAYEFSPSNYTSLAGKENIKLWIKGLNTLQFDGFKFSAPDVETVTVPKASATFEPGDDADEGEYTVAIPAGFAGTKGTTITLANVKAADGYNHEGDIRGLYDTFAITHATPANGSKLASLEDGEIITIDTNYAEQYPDMIITYQVVDLNPADPDQAVIKTEADMHRQDDGSYTSEVIFDYTLYAGHQYRAEFTAYANEDAKNYSKETLGTDYVTWEGTTPAFKYSTIELVSITPSPEDGVITADDREFVVEFDGLVTLNSETTFINRGQGMTVPFESIEPTNPQTSDEGVSYSDEWTLTVSESYMSSLQAQLDLSVKAYDMNGRIVKGNEGEEDHTYFYFSYDFAGRFAEFDAYLEGNVNNAESVDKVYVSNSLGIEPSWNVQFTEAYVMNPLTRETIAHFTDEDLEKEIDQLPDEEQFSATNTWLAIHLDNAITTPGTYVACFPEGLFNIGTEMNQFNSELKFYEFTVGAPSEQPTERPNITVDPAEGAVTSLKEISIIFDDYETISLGSGIITVLRNKQQLETLDADLDNDMWNKATITLGEEYTEDGAYTIVIPEGYFQLGDNGEACPAFTLQYTIGEEPAPAGPNITVDPAEGAVTSLSQVEIWFNDYESAGLGAGKATLTINGGTLINLDDAEWGADDNSMVQALDQAYTADGTYVISFPAGYFQLGDNGDDCPAFTLTYTIGGEDPTPAERPNITVDPAEGAVTSLSQVEIWFNDYESAGLGAGKATLTINGGTPINLDDAEWGADYNSMVQALDQAYTADGTYVISFPAGYFLLGDNGDDCPAFTLTYTIGDPSGVDGIIINAEGDVKVFDLKGVLRVNGDKEQLKNLPAGIYIVNGTKVVIK